MRFGSASVDALLSSAGAGSTDVRRAAAGDGARRESKALVETRRTIRDSGRASRQIRKP
jgi:hypothetical protein